MYKITGTIPQPMASLTATYYAHHESAMPRFQRNKPIGEAGHKVSVMTENEKVAVMLTGIFDNLFENVIMEEQECTEEK